MDDFSPKYQIFTALERPDLYKTVQDDHDHPLGLVWPPYFGQTESQIKYWHLLAAFPEIAKFQFMVVGPGEADSQPKIIAQANSIPFHRPMAKDGHGDFGRTGAIYRQIEYNCRRK